MYTWTFLEHTALKKQNINLLCECTHGKRTSCSSQCSSLITWGQEWNLGHRAWQQAPFLHLPKVNGLKWCSHAGLRWYIATSNQSLINSALPQSYWLQAASTGLNQGLLSSPWWSSFCDGTCGNFLTASVFILFEAWARNQDYVHPHPKGTPLQVGWPRSHSRHCELELGCDICRRAGLE